MIRKHRGFLLINSAITLAILIILATLSISMARVMHSALLRAEIEKIYALFFYMQQQALILQKEQSIKFDITNNTYKTAERFEQLAPGIRFGVLSNVYGPPSEPVNLLMTPVTFTHQEAYFYKDGTMSAGTIYLTDDHRLYALTSGVSTVPFLRKYYYQAGKWAIL